MTIGLDQYNGTSVQVTEQESTDGYKACFQGVWAPAQP